jgi:hypothetical protein
MTDEREKQLIRNGINQGMALGLVIGFFGCLMLVWYF